MESATFRKSGDYSQVLSYRTDSISKEVTVNFDYHSASRMFYYFKQHCIRLLNKNCIHGKAIAVFAKLSRFSSNLDRSRTVKTSTKRFLAPRHSTITRTNLFPIYIITCQVLYEQIIDLKTRESDGPGLLPSVWLRISADILTLSVFPPSTFQARMLCLNHVQLVSIFFINQLFFIRTKTLESLFLMHDVKTDIESGIHLVVYGSRLRLRRCQYVLHLYEIESRTVDNLIRRKVELLQLSSVVSKSKLLSR
ncbi:hypothetical protein CSKR_105530 [Clonorchis sinensis]|uniref:Uncharacterized protein n=1 Tax=Clonorchis sinensis TaxID=79923 RepID=A0A3R7GQX7_CLOSI|nr:hypothetical protein CSKR_105530 [Clonorchis sinensis]